jgi:N-acetylneuraminate synthase/N,N'-diacetyllegionaminate synthase
MSEKITRVFIIAEAGVNHNGQLELAYRLCDAAKEAGADAVKFQTWKTERILTKDVAKAEYQKLNDTKSDSQFELIKKLELSYSQFEKIYRYCEKIGIKFLSTPEEEESLAFLVKLGVDRIKVGSGDINNIPYLRKIGMTRLPVILSTGMSTLADVEKAFDTLTISGSSQVTLLHCTTNYPCPPEEVNLRAMQTLAGAFKVPVGYSDHTEGIEVALAAVAMGARVIEKHFTLDCNMEGPDHKASLEPEELKQMIRSIRNIEKALGDGIKKPNQSERKIETVVKKKIVAAKHITKGEILSENNITLKRSENGIAADLWDMVNGRNANSDYDTDEPITL